MFKSAEQKDADRQQREMAAEQERQAIRHELAELAAINAERKRAETEAEWQAALRETKNPYHM